MKLFPCQRIFATALFLRSVSHSQCFTNITPKTKRHPTAATRAREAKEVNKRARLELSEGTGIFRTDDQQRNTALQAQYHGPVNTNFTNLNAQLFYYIQTTNTVEQYLSDLVVPYHRLEVDDRPQPITCRNITSNIYNESTKVHNARLFATPYV